MEEIWRDIEGYEGYYQVSNIGRVKSLRRYVKCRNNSRYLVKERIRKEGLDKNGYVTVTLKKAGKMKSFKIHRLVAMAFIPNPHNKLEVNHLDGSKRNNEVSNLCWSTRKENIQHASDYCLNRILKPVDINNIVTMYKPRSKEFNVRKIAAMYGVSKSTIFNCIKKFGAV